MLCLPYVILCLHRNVTHYNADTSYIVCITACLIVQNKTCKQRFSIPCFRPCLVYTGSDKDFGEVKQCRC